MTKSLKLQDSALERNNPKAIAHLIPMVTSREIRIYDAYLHAKKFSQYETVEELLLLNSYFERWAQNIGADIPDANALNNLSNFMVETYPKMNATDLDECITLHVAGQLELQKHVQTYNGRMPPSFVAQVVNVYTRHKADIVFKVRGEINRLPEDTPVPTDEQRLNDYKTLILLGKQAVDAGHYYDDLMCFLYDFIKHNKLIRFTKTLKADALKHAENEFKKDNYQKTITAVVSNMSFNKVREFNDAKHEKILSLSKKYVTNQWLKTVNTDELFDNFHVGMLNY